MSSPPSGNGSISYDWAMQDPQVRREYGGLVVAVHGREVWGAGKTSGCHDLDELVFVAVSAPGFGPNVRMF